MKKANLFVVGGPISVGKSTLVEGLPFPQVPELNEGDKLQEILLRYSYEKERVAAEVIEYYFLEERKHKYIDHCDTLNTYVLDRSIFESLWFARGNMSQESFVHFEKLWEAEIKDLINTYGEPKIYFLLTCSWSTFRERIFARGRDVEIHNFANNENFFKQHIAEYEEHMIAVFKRFNLDYIVINTDNKDKDQVLKETQEHLTKYI